MTVRIQLASRIYVVPNLLSPSECHTEIQKGSELGFSEQRFGIRLNGEPAPEARQRTHCDDVPHAEFIWQRLAVSLPTAAELFPDGTHADPPLSLPAIQWRAVGLNERLRWYRYGVGQRFSVHTDFSHMKNELERSLLTLIVFLNDDFQGGGTRFETATVTPRAGQALVFPHELLHEGLPVTRGVKTILRSDVMFRADGAL